MKKKPVVVAVSGLKNSGKTSLIEKLIPKLNQSGLRVATIKHDGHRFDADCPGTDSFRHLAAGAEGSAVFDGEKYQIVRFGKTDEEYLISLFGDVDLILLEGFKNSPWPKLEIVCAENGGQAVCHPSARLALIADRDVTAEGCRVFSRDDISGIADFLIRFTRIGERFSAVILADGYSSRIGKNKAELLFEGKRLIDHQGRRLRMLGIEDILIAGYEGPAEYGRCVPDLVPHRGPLSGIYMGLSEAAHTDCLVLRVDAPLVPFSVLVELMEQHCAGVTMLEHNGQLEPLIGIYNSSLAPLCGEILSGGNPSVKRLLEKCAFSTIQCELPATPIKKCDTPERYET